MKRPLALTEDERTLLVRLVWRILRRRYDFHPNALHPIDPGPVAREIVDTVGFALTGGELE